MANGIMNKITFEAIKLLELLPINSNNRRSYHEF